LLDWIREQGIVQDEAFDALKVISQREEGMGFKGVQEKGSVQGFFVKQDVPFRRGKKVFDPHRFARDSVAS
jgi:hypothetical protein